MPKHAEFHGNYWNEFTKFECSQPTSSNTDITNLTEAHLRFSTIFTFINTVKEWKAV